MAYTARGLIDYARSIADLQNTKFISYTDEITLINEAYRDIHSQYTESDGDYWDTEVIINVDGSMADPNNQFGYLIPLPIDFMKIRSLSYNQGGFWLPVNKFATSNRDNNPSQPCYRLKNNTLWVIGGKNLYTQLKMNYYPIPEVITAPDVDITLAEDETIYNYPNILSHVYNYKSNSFIYALGKVIKSENLDSASTYSLYTSTNAISSVTYFAGYVYWLDTVANILYRAPTDFTNSLVPVSVKTAVTNFSIQGNFIYYSTASDTRKCALDGTLDSQLQTYPSIAYTLFGSHYLYIGAANAIYIDGVDSGITGLRILTDSLYIYILSLDGKLIRYTLGAANALTVIETISEGVYSLGTAISGNYISIVTAEAVYAQSLIVDTVLDYPTNEVNEILAYTSAIAYVRKQADQVQMAILKDRLTELWMRFWSANKRDEYQFTRINNDYQQALNNW